MDLPVSHLDIFKAVFKRLTMTLTYLPSNLMHAGCIPLEPQNLRRCIVVCVTVRKHSETLSLCLTVLHYLFPVLVAYEQTTF